MKIFESLDPILLPSQIRRIQDALWQHAVQQTPGSRTPEATVNFNANKCMSPNQKNIDFSKVDPLSTFKKSTTRHYSRTKKARTPRTWRTRKNPFENVWGEGCCWFKERPDRTAKSIFEELQQRYPGEFKNGQLRTQCRDM